MNDEHESPAILQPHAFLRCEELRLFGTGPCDRCGVANCHRVEGDSIHAQQAEKAAEVAA